MAALFLFRSLKFWPDQTRYTATVAGLTIGDTVTVTYADTAGVVVIKGGLQSAGITLGEAQFVLNVGVE